MKEEEKKEEDDDDDESFGRKGQRTRQHQKKKTIKQTPLTLTWIDQLTRGHF